ncbi:uncharacterized protein [Antedon mediterranea]|uniref:uncharacterized protein isoform X2 n=1 Tax=Antedon mediterranea TaxID=105859 RepID=UPI003AF4E58C
MFKMYLALLCVMLMYTDAKYVGTNDISKVKRQVDIPNEECYNFDLNATSKRYYTCCKGDTNCTNNVGSSNYDCSPYGETIYTKNINSEFNCGKCNGKKWATAKCTARWKLTGINDDNERCWIWSECFKGACAAQEVAYLDESKSVPQETNFCGDGFCVKDTGETVDNCPIDCCPTINSAQCAVTSEKCTDPCCNESTCCITSLSVIYIAILCGGIGFLNLLCCCICVCCYRKVKRTCGFKSHKHTKSISIDNLSRDSPKSTISNRRGSPSQSNLAYKSNSLASLNNKKVYYLRPESHSPRPSYGSSTSLNKKGFSRSTQSLDRIA